jgi:rhodanese-related sulfurtransferase
MQNIFSNIFQELPKYINFEDMQIILKKREKYIIINTLSIHEQDCLIKYTLPYNEEEKIINDSLSFFNKSNKKIIIYGKNSYDNSIDKKYKQLLNLGFVDIYIYKGGMFEWLLLQDIYGFELFPTTSKNLDLLKYRPIKIGIDAL